MMSKSGTFRKGSAPLGMLIVRLSTAIFMTRRLNEMPSPLRLKLVATLFGKASNVLMVAFAAIVCGTSGWLHQRSIPLAGIGICEVILLLARCRLILAFQQAKRAAVPMDAERWLAPFGFLAVASSCCWGAICFAALFTAHQPVVYMLPVICTVATAGAIAARNSGVPRLAQMQLACSLFPLFAGCALATDGSLRLLLLLLPALTFGLLVLVSERNLQLVELIEVQHELERLSMTDTLTQVSNRRAFDFDLRAACMPGETVSLLMIDVDHFKAFNDRHGHGEGDALLKRIAATLQEGLASRRERVARVGGEEFTILLPGVEPPDALVLAEGLRLLVASRCRDPLDDQPVTISIGVATITNGDTSQLLARADKALYLAKDGGRNRIVESGLAIAA